MRYFRKNKVLSWTVKRIENIYLKIYPLNEKLVKDIHHNHIEPKERIKEINEIRVSNLNYAIYSNAGALLALFIAIFTMFFAFFLAFEAFFVDKAGDELKYVIPILALVSSYLLLLVASPFLIREIIRNLTPVEYAEISMNNIDPSQMLTFVAFKLYDLCLKYEKKRNLDTLNYALGDFRRHYSQKALLTALNRNSPRIIQELEQVRRNIKDFLSEEFYKDYYKLVEIRKLASQNLKLHSREFSHHILQFSPALFQDQLSTLFLSVDTLSFLIRERNIESRHELIFQHLQEIYAIDNNIARGKEAVSQIIFYKHTHKYLIGISSVTSTSRALSIFCRAITQILNQGIKDQERKKSTEVLSSRVIGEFKTILFRSKAHYGFDLLLTVENMYHQYSCLPIKKSIPRVLYNLRHHRRGVPGIEKQAEADLNFKDLLYKYLHEIRNMRAFLVDKLEKEREAVRNQFTEHFDAYLQKKGRKVIIIFGYSRVVRLALRTVADKLVMDDRLIFIMREDRLHMIDTRTFRFELSSAPTNRVRNTFTASDDFFKSLIRPDDHFLFLCGAEAYCPQRNLLMHTNTYQKRVEGLLTYLEQMTDPENNAQEVDRQLWILAEKYKVYDDFPPQGYLFRKEMFSDHYDDVDLYNFTRFIHNGLKVVHIPEHTDDI